MAVFYIDNVSQDSLTMTQGSIYRFDQSNSSNDAAPISLSETSDGDNAGAGGSPYEVGVSYWLNNVETNRSTYIGAAFGSTTGSRFIQIQVDASAPGTLYYYAVGTAGYGGSITVTA